jgi:hypothetical protein
MDELYDMLKAKYGVDSSIELSNQVNDKMHSVVEAGRKLNMCCCALLRQRQDTYYPETNHFYHEEIYDCQTCKRTGKLA